jgi:hypothetical protein
MSLMRTTVSRQIKPHGELDKIRKRKGLVLFQLNFDGGLDSDTEHPFKLYTSGREGTLRGRRGDIVLQDHVQSGASGFTRNLHIGTLNSMRRKVGKECASCDYVFRSDCNSRSVNRRRILSKHCVARQCGFRSYVSADSGLFACSRSTFLLLFGGCTYCIGEGD